jgi:hypothetical protein
MRRLLFVILLTNLSLMAKEPAPVAAPYDKGFDPWRACMAAEPVAKRGNPDALRTCFLAAYVRVSQPFLGGEDLEGMARVYNDLFTTLGDAAFARALAKERPEIHSAVRWFISESPKLKTSPNTARLFRNAPKIDWPIDRAYREDR